MRPVAKYVDLASHYFIYLLQMLRVRPPSYLAYLFIILLCLELGRLAATTAAGVVLFWVKLLRIPVPFDFTCRGCREAVGHESGRPGAGRGALGFACCH